MVSFDPGRRICIGASTGRDGSRIPWKKSNQRVKARGAFAPASVLGGRASVARAGGRTSATLSAFVLALGVAA
jgi:hypothetical protein